MEDFSGFSFGGIRRPSGHGSEVSQETEESEAEAQCGELAGVSRHGDKGNARKNPSFRIVF